MTTLNMILLAFLFATIFIVLLSHKIRILRMQKYLQFLDFVDDSAVHRMSKIIDEINLIKLDLKELKASPSPSNKQDHSPDSLPVSPTLN